MVFDGSNTSFKTSFMVITSYGLWLYGYIYLCECVLNSVFQNHCQLLATNPHVCFWKIPRPNLPI
jgi:hypothetical protein